MDNHHNLTPAGAKPARAGLTDNFVINGYHPIGEGSHGSVILGRRRDTREPVAIKVVNRLSPLGKINTRIYIEVDIMKLCHHPNIITYFDCFVGEDAHYIVMEYAPYGDLFQYTIGNIALSTLDHKNIFVQVLSAVEYCHANQIAHRDLKLENILITSVKPFTVKIADFGLATNVSIDSLHNSFCGTFFYAAYEIICCKPYDPKKVDIWSLGVILYSMVTKHHPWPSEDIVNHIRTLNYDKTLIKDKLLKDLISKMLVPPEDRITINQIKKHAWLIKRNCAKTFYNLCTTKYKAMKKRRTT